MQQLIALHNLLPDFFYLPVYCVIIYPANAFT